jgi:hypothetical protein
VSDIVVISLPPGPHTKPVKVGGGKRHLVVNRADPGDRNVVISFDTPVTTTGSFGPGQWWEKTEMHRDAIGFTPRQAREMARALVRAADMLEAGDA